MSSIPFKEQNQDAGEGYGLHEVLVLRQELSEQRILAGESEWLASRAHRELEVLRGELARVSLSLDELEKSGQQCSLCLGPLRSTPDNSSEFGDQQVTDNSSGCCPLNHHCCSEVENLKDQLHAVFRSRSWRIGRVITSPRRVFWRR